MSTDPWLSVARLWDDCAHAARRQRQGVVLRVARAPIRISVSRLDRDGWVNLLSHEYSPDGRPGRRNSLAFRVFDDSRRRLRRPLLLMGSQYCRAANLLSEIRTRNTAIAASIPPKMVHQVVGAEDWSFLSSSDWDVFGGSAGSFLAPIKIGHLDGSLFAFDSEPVELPRRGTKFLAYFGEPVSCRALACVVHASRVPLAPRSSSRFSSLPRSRNSQIAPPQRPNMAIAVQQDNRLLPTDTREATTSNQQKKPILFADLFAGAGGLSLGFLKARNARYELTSAVDISPICIKTLRRNLVRLKERHEVTGTVSDNPFRLADLTNFERAEHLLPSELAHGHIDVVVGGPPCQPFSSARRRPANNAEARLVDSFSRAIELLQPTAFVLENVQGILWQSSSGQSPAQKLMEQVEKAGYRVAAQVLDAVWFGAPQHRARAFIIGLHSRLANGTKPEDAFPTPIYTGTPSRPYRTVMDSIGDLPEIPNGHSRFDISASSRPKGAKRSAGARILDHVTSRHADYVIARFRRLEPGENWTAIRDMMTNYTSCNTTHSNIYRRLEWNKPSVTLGHYRKSMLVHPSQDRGLSLREALRLQSFPDWYRLWGHEETLTIGLDRKQQLLANAVPPVLAQAVAEQLAEVIR